MRMRIAFGVSGAIDQRDVRVELEYKTVLSLKLLPATASNCRSGLLCT